MIFDVLVDPSSLFGICYVPTLYIHWSIQSFSHSFICMAKNVSKNWSRTIFSFWKLHVYSTLCSYWELQSIKVLIANKRIRGFVIHCQMSFLLDSKHAISFVWSPPFWLAESKQTGFYRNWKLLPFALKKRRVSFLMILLNSLLLDKSFSACLWHHRPVSTLKVTVMHFCSKSILYFLK